MRKTKTKKKSLSRRRTVGQTKVTDLLQGTLNKFLHCTHHRRFNCIMLTDPVVLNPMKLQHHYL